jgi:hypothetical protein
MKILTERDWEKIELYMKAGATQIRIAEAFGMERDTLRKKIQQRYDEDYAVVVNRFRTTGELLIEATQFQKALAGNIQLLIWLGKIRCGQREPDNVATLPPAQNEIDKDHVIMELQHKIETLNELLAKYGHEREAE